MTGKVALSDFSTAYSLAVPAEPVAISDLCEGGDRSSRNDSLWTWQKTSSYHPWQQLQLSARLFALHYLQMIIGDIRRHILPAFQNYEHGTAEFFSEIKQMFLNEPLNCCSSIKATTSDGVVLDGVIFWKDSEDFTLFSSQESSSALFCKKPWVIHCIGNSMCYEQCLEAGKLFVSEHPCNLILFNYRGIVDSEGKFNYTKELCLDLEAFRQYLIDRGVSPREIKFSGYSLGGGVATETCAERQGSALRNERSFDRLSRFLAGAISEGYYRKWTHVPRQASIFYPTWLRRCNAKIASAGLRHLIEFALQHPLYELDAASAWDRIITKRKWIIFAEKDQMIAYSWSLYRHVTNSSTASTYTCAMANIGHADPLTEEAKAFDNLQWEYALQSNTEISD